jgi:hypoxanthine-DNA glycosylase
MAAAAAVTGKLTDVRELVGLAARKSSLPAGRSRLTPGARARAACQGKSRSRRGATYAHPQNRFWQLIGKVIGVELEPLEYEERLEALLGAKVGLWDTVASAHRAGSLDAAIREAEHNPLAKLAVSLPQLRAVGFNGKTSTKIGMPQLAGTGLALIPLPSSSPAHATMRLAEKEKLWGQLREFLA